MPYADFEDDLGRGPTPALLAAKAEPLGSPSVQRRPSRRPAKPGRPANAGQAARASKARTRSQGRRKPKEPSKALMVVAVVAIIAAGFGAAYVLTGGGGGSGTDTDDTGLGTTTLPATENEQAAETSLTTQAPADATATVPVVVFDEAAFGPIEAGTEYTVGVNGGPTDAMYQLLVDGEPQAEAAPELPPTTFAPGRHLLEVEITGPGGNASTDPVVVYALGELAPASFGANLASVNTDENVEGWAEAIRRFDEFVAAGHTDLQLVPSDLYPSMPAGYWVLHVGGFPDLATAEAYCADHDMVIPDECWGREFDPAAPASS